MVSLLLFLCLQDPPEITSRDAPTTFNSKVTLVNVPVVVRDSKGNAIGNLRKEDFQLFDKGKPQTISKFTIEKADGRLVPLEISADEKAPEGPPPANRFVAYLFDDLHTAFGDLAQSREAALKHLAKSMTGTARAAIYTTSGLNNLDFTDDQEKLRQTLNQITPRSRAVKGPSDCPQVTEYMADMVQNKNDTFLLSQLTADAITCSGGPPYISQTVAEAQARSAVSRVLSVSELEAQIALQVLKATVQRMGSMPGTRTIVLVSSGFLVTQTHRMEEVELIDRAIKTNVTINTLDARGLYTVGIDASQSVSNLITMPQKTRYLMEEGRAQGEVLGELADGTGGTFFNDNNDLQEGFRRAGAPPEFMYVLGFSPQNLKYDGSFHALKVTARETKNVSLQARRGYYAPRHAADPAEDAKEEIRVALFSRDEMTDIPVEMQTQFFKPTGSAARLSVLAHVDLKHLRFKKAEGRNRNTLSIVSAVFDRNGVLVGAIQKDVEMRFKEETLDSRLTAGVSMKTSFNVAPGSYVVRLVVRDSEGQTMAARNRVVEIP